MKNNFEVYVHIKLAIPLAVLFKAWLCGRSLVGISCSVPDEGIDICLLRVLCAVELITRPELS